MADPVIHAQNFQEPPSTAVDMQIRARRESIPRHPRDLTDDQQRAAAQSISLIHSIARGRVPVSPADPQVGLARLLPSLDEWRLNHNVLIDGGRGSGKTSVLLSVLKYWNHVAHANLAQLADRSYVDAVNEMIRRLSSAEAESPGGERGENAVTGATDSRPAVILPLHIIDLQPLAPSTDLRMFLASSFRRAMEAVSAPAYAKPRWAPDVPAQWPPDSGTGVREAWSTFRDVVASGSDHIAHRRSQLDAVTYAVELEQAEATREVAGAFTAFIDALRDAYLRSEITRWGQMRPLFVLPIDDADMNPRLGAGLIETINLLSHDDVAYLLTGDTELFLLLLREHLAGGFRHSLRSVDLEHDDTTNIGDLIHLRSLAHQVYDKHIPNAHRCRIDPLPGSERVKRLAGPGNSLRRVGGAFEPLPSEVHSNAECVRRLAYYFDLHEERAEDTARTRATERFVDAALPETMRGLEDAREAINAAVRRAENPEQSAIAEVVRYFWRDRINGSLLRGNERRDLHDVVRLEEPDLPRADDQGDDGDDLPPHNLRRLSASTEKFAVQNTRLERDIIARNLVSGEFAREHRWAAREILDYEFRLRDEGRARAGAPGGPAHPGGLLLPSGVGAALILATDVAADLPTGIFIGKTLSPEEFDAPFVLTSIFIRKEGEYFDFPWPMPDWDSFRDFHVFSKAWAEVVGRLTRRLRGSAAILDHLVIPFIALVASVAYDRHGTSPSPGSTDELKRVVDGWRPPRTSADPLEEAPWGHLTSLIETYLLRPAAAHRRDQDFRHWYHNRLLLLAAPESGLTPAVANALYNRLLRARMNEFHKPADFKETARGARVARANRVRIGGGKETGVPVRAFYTEAADRKVDDLLMDIDKSLGKRLFVYPRHLRSVQKPDPEDRSVPADEAPF